MDTIQKDEEQKMHQVVKDYAEKLRDSIESTKKDDEEELFTYKCRAECPADAEKLRKRCHRRLGGNFRDFSVVVDPELGEAEITFSCSVPHYRIHRLLQIDRMTDCHVMHETLNLASQYTGKRNYSMSRVNVDSVESMQQFFAQRRQRRLNQ